MRAVVAAAETGGLRAIPAEAGGGGPPGPGARPNPAPVWRYAPAVWGPGSGHAGPVELTNPALAWRYDPAVVGPSSCLADAGSHALHMACFVSGQQIQDVAALFTSHGEGRQLEDDAHLHLRFSGGAVGSLWT